MFCFVFIKVKKDFLRNKKNVLGLEGFFIFCVVKYFDTIFELSFIKFIFMFIFSLYYVSATHSGVFFFLWWGSNCKGPVTLPRESCHTLINALFLVWGKYLGNNTLDEIWVKRLCYMYRLSSITKWYCNCVF